MATTEDHIEARNDPDLLDRFVAAAEQRDMENARDWVMANMGRLVNQDIAAGQTISDVHAFARITRDHYLAAVPERPGANLSAVTDANLHAAIESLDSTPPSDTPANTL